MEGLSNAVSIHGGIDYVRNLRTGPTEDLGFKIDAEIDTFAVASLTPPAGSETNKERGLALHLTSMSYEFALHFGRRGPAYSVAKDRLILEGHLHEQPEGPKTRKKLLGKPQLGKAIGPTKLEYSVQSKKLSWKFSFPGGYTEGPNVSKAIQSLLGATGQKKPRIAGLMLEEELLLAPYLFPFFSIQDIFTGIAIFDFDPKLSKKASGVEGNIGLTEDGGNIAVALREIRRSPKKYRSLINHVRDVLPFVQTLQASKMLDKSFILTVRESYGQEYNFPASMMSDGTLEVICLVVALYFDDSWLVILEEPERNIHPDLLAGLVGKMRDRSNAKQIIITSHNPEIVKHVGLDALRLVVRDKEGFSSVIKPAGSDAVRELAENLSLDKLFVKQLLGE